MGELGLGLFILLLLAIGLWGLVLLVFFKGQRKKGALILVASFVAIMLVPGDLETKTEDVTLDSTPVAEQETLSSTATESAPPTLPAPETSTVAEAPSAPDQDGCTEYERKVFAMVDRARMFQRSDQFREYGWSRVKKGPTNGWLDDFKKLRDATSNEDALAFLHKHDFSLANVYQVANAYRTDGHLDSFYQDLSDAIDNAQRCDEK